MRTSTCWGWTWARFAQAPARPLLSRPCELPSAPCPARRDPDGTQLLGWWSSQQVRQLQERHPSSCLPLSLLADGHRLPHTWEDTDLQTRPRSSPMDTSTDPWREAWPNVGNRLVVDGATEDQEKTPVKQCWSPSPCRSPSPRQPQPAVHQSPGGRRSGAGEEVQPPTGQGNTATMCYPWPADRRSSSCAPFQTRHLEKGSGSHTQVTE